MNITLNKISTPYFNSMHTCPKQNQKYVNPAPCNEFLASQSNCNPFSSLCPNLASLGKDIVSFSGRAELIASSMEDAPSKKMVSEVEENAEPARYYLECVLDKYLQPITQETSMSSPRDFPVLYYTTRTKSTNSIREKVVSKYTKIHSAESEQFANGAVDNLMKYYELQPGEDKKQAAAVAKRVIKYSFANTKIPPYENAVYYLVNIIDDFNSLGIMDFKDDSPSRLKSVLTLIVDEMEQNAPESHCEDGVYINPKTIKGIKHYANDIAGGRIVMRESGKEYTAGVLSALKQAVDDGVLKITSIENNVPGTDKLPEGKTIEDYQYATYSQLKSLANAADAPLIQNETKSGYMGIHVNVDISDPILCEYNGVFNGYSGEIQIIGADVLELKEVEDLCYKLKDSKNAIQAKYKDFKKHFQIYYNDETKDAFEDYTNALYLAQRDIPPGSIRRTSFPSIKDLGFEGKLPPELDFNYLRELKKSCDKKAETKKNKTEESKSEKNSSQNDTLKTIKKQGDIETIKKLIAYKIKNS